MGPHAGIAGLRHIEGQIAFYKAELHITDAQTAQWNAFADTLRSGAKQLQDGLPSHDAGRRPALRYRSAR